jgi:predicted TIM-barrel fold metal-dependent hydrolase
MSEKKQPIIDIHTHAFDTLLGWDFIPNEKIAELGLTTPNSIEEHTEISLKYLKEHNVKAVTFGPASKKWKKRAPNNIIHALPIETTSELASIESLKRSYENGELNLLGEITNQYRGLPPNHQSLGPYFKLANDLDISVLIHMGLAPPNITRSAWGFNYRSNLSNPFLLEDVMNKYPDLRICIAHACWPMLDSLLHMMFVYPNLYTDISMINWALTEKEFFRYFGRLVDAGFHKQILYGSDLAVWPDAIPVSIERTNNAPFLSEEQKRDIFYNNAKRFLKL